ncbi:MAG: DMT family transporter [Myxococcota bacterium]|nr:DMT family transporter [Myxococcota bacterium]
MALTDAARGRLRGDLALLLITAVWGGTFVLVKDSLDQADPFTFLTLRFSLGALAAAAIARGDLWHKPSVRYGLLLGVFLFLGYALQTTGLQHTTPSRSAFITGMTIVLVPFVSIVLFKRLPRIPSLLGVGLAVLGLYWLTLAEGAASTSGTLRGDLLTFGCTVAYAFHIAWNERLAPKAKVMAMVTVQLTVVAVLSALCLPLLEVRLVWNPTLLWGVVFTGLFASTLAIGVQTWGQARTTAVRAALIFSLEPVFAALYSVAVGREALGRRELVGGGLIIFGVAVAEVGNALWDRWLVRQAGKSG